MSPTFECAVQPGLDEVSAVGSVGGGFGTTYVKLFVFLQELHALGILCSAS